MNDCELRITRQTTTLHLWPLNAFAHKKFDTSTDMGRQECSKSGQTSIGPFCWLSKDTFRVSNNKPHSGFARVGVRIATVVGQGHNSRFSNFDERTLP
jgi:hypothetical protein